MNRAAWLVITAVAIWALAPRAAEQTGAPASAADSARRSPPAPEASLDPLRFVPRGTAAVLSLDLRRLRQSPLGALLTAPDRELGGIGRLEAVCGFDPTAQIETLVLALPRMAAGEPTDFGVVALGSFDAVATLGCASAVITKRGGVPLTSTLGSFTRVRARTGAEGELASRPGGPALLGDGRTLHELVEVAEGSAPSLAGDRLHHALRVSVGEESALLVSVALPADWLEQALDSELVRESPLSRVRALALGADVAPELTVRAVVGCDDQAACQELGDLLEELRERELVPWLERELTTDLGRRVVLERADRQVRAMVTLSPSEATALLERALSQ